MFIRSLVGSEIRKGEKLAGPELVDWEEVGGKRALVPSGQC